MRGFAEWKLDSVAGRVTNGYSNGGHIYTTPTHYTHIPSNQSLHQPASTIKMCFSLKVQQEVRDIMSVISQNWNDKNPVIHL